MQIYPPKKKKKRRKKKSKFYLLFLFLFFLLRFLKKRRKKNFIKIKMVSTKTIDGNGNLFLLYIYIYIINNFFLTMMGFGFCTWELRLFIIKKKTFYLLIICCGILAYGVFIILAAGVLVSTRSYFILIKNFNKLRSYILIKNKDLKFISLQTLESLFNYSFTLTTLRML